MTFSAEERAVGNALLRLPFGGGEKVVLEIYLATETKKTDLLPQAFQMLSPGGKADLSLWTRVIEKGVTWFLTSSRRRLSCRQYYEPNSAKRKPFMIMFFTGEECRILQ
jgi:hypothetical protein